jgi:serine/threonine protein kinase
MRIMSTFLIDTLTLWEQIELQEKVGHWSSADIYRGTWRGIDVAVKCIDPDYFLSNVNGVSFFAQEVETLSRQRHPFVLHLLGACLEPPNHGWVVTELLGMTLKDWLHGPGKRQKERTVPFPPIEERLGGALEIAQAMQYLHQQNPKVIHHATSSLPTFSWMIPTTSGWRILVMPVS